MHRCRTRTVLAAAAEPPLTNIIMEPQWCRVRMLAIIRPLAVGVEILAINNTIINKVIQLGYILLVKNNLCILFLQCFLSKIGNLLKVLLLKVIM